MIEEPTNFEKNSMAIAFALAGVIMISFSFKLDIISLIVGIAGIFALAMGSIIRGSIDSGGGGAR